MYAHYRKMIAQVMRYTCWRSESPFRHGKLVMLMLMSSRYANQAASDAHLTTRPVQDLISLFTTGDVLAQPPEIQNCPVLAKRKSGSPPVVSSKPTVVLVNFVPGPCAAIQSSEYWTKFAERAINETNGMSTIVVVKDREGKSTRVECVLQDWDTSAELRKTMVMEGKFSIEFVNIVPIDGFISREEQSRL